jgi:hypothetical protein
VQTLARWAAKPSNAANTQPAIRFRVDGIGALQCELEIRATIA